MKVFLILSLCAVIASTQDTCGNIAGTFRRQDSTCRKYFKCVSYNGKILQSNYTCPTGKPFNPTTKLCDPNMVCIQDICLRDVNTEAGDLLPDPNNAKCTTYIECVSFNGGLIPILETCPTGYFNQIVSACVATGDCS